MIDIIKKLFEKYSKNKQIKDYKKTKNQLDDLTEIFDSLNEDTIQVIIGEDIVSYVNDIIEEIGDIRTKIKNNSGYIIPIVHITSKSHLQENQYQILIQGKKVFEDYIVPNQSTCRKEIPQNIEEVCFEHIDKIFSCKLFEYYIKSVQKRNPYMVWDLTYRIPICKIREVLISLIKDGISIKNIDYVFSRMDEIIVNSETNYISTDRIIKELSEELKPI